MPSRSFRIYLMRIVWRASRHKARKRTIASPSTTREGSVVHVFHLSWRERSVVETDPECFREEKTRFITVCVSSNARSSRIFWRCWPLIHRERTVFGRCFIERERETLEKRESSEQFREQFVLAEDEAAFAALSMPQREVDAPLTLIDSYGSPR